MEIIYGDEHPSIAKLVDDHLSTTVERVNSAYVAPELITRIWCDYVSQLREFDNMYRFPVESRLAISYILNDCKNPNYYSAKFPQGAG
jgi:hypothetical protein